jgi:L-fuculose-phosphate aldolase
MKTAGIHPLAQAIAHYCNCLYQRGLSPAHTGNVSARDGDLIWITPAGLGMKDVTPENLVLLRQDGTTLGGPDERPSSESLMHLAIYREKPELGAIVHAHPPKATALAVARQPLDKPILAEMAVSLPEVPVVSFAPPGSEHLAELVATAIKTHPALLLSNHGVVATGKTIDEAYYCLDLLENFAEVYLLSRQLGEPTVLTLEQVAAIHNATDI